MRKGICYQDEETGEIIGIPENAATCPHCGAWLTDQEGDICDGCVEEYGETETKA